MGLYLSLTGARAGAADGMYLGFGRHFVPQARFDELTDALASGSGAVDAVLARFGADAGKSRLAAMRPAIDRCFGQDSVEAIVCALRNEPGEWAKEALAAMERASPLSLKLAFRILQRGRGSRDRGCAHARVPEVMMHVLRRRRFLRRRARGA